MKTAIVLGANGYLGRHIAYFLKKQNVSFTPVGSSTESKDGYSNYRSIDIRDKEALATLDYKVDYIFMFAGITGTKTDKASVQYYTEVNEIGLKNVLDCCIGSKARIIFPSSRLVYKGVKNTPLNENSEKEAKTIYARNKINCEQLLAKYSEQKGINYTTFRICVPYGNLIDDVYSYGTLGFFLSKAQNNENITLYGDGSLKRTFTHVSDITQSILKAVEQDNTNKKTYNIGSNDSLSLLSVAQLIAEKYSVKVEHIEWPEEALKIESGDTIFSGELLFEDVGYAYQHTLSKWIETI